MKKQPPKPKKQQPTDSAKPAAKVVEKPFSWSIFAGKIALLLALVVAVVAYTDKKEYFVGDQTNNHVERKWRSFYRFTDKGKKDVDILLLGNSHISAGVEPYILSINTGTYSQILNSLGATVIQAYFNLREVLKYTKPRLAVLETHCVYMSELGGEWGRIQSFEAKKNDWDKLAIMPIIFKSDEWIKAWSPTIRNHSFLLTDPARIEFNISHKDKNPDRQRLDLGRFSHGHTYMKPATQAKYDSVSPIQADKIQIGKLNRKYLRKLYELCCENGVELVLLSVPMYHGAFNDYSTVKKMEAEAFAECCPRAKWLDLQQNYDTTLFTAQAFNDEYNNAQHMTYHGMTICAYKLSEFIVQNYADKLPDRSANPEWIADFSSQSYYLYARNVPPDMLDVVSIVRNKSVDGFHIHEMYMQTGQNSNTLVIKTDKSQQALRSITVSLLIKQGNGSIQVPVQMQSFREITPPTNNVYMVELNKNITVVGVAGIAKS